MPDPIRIATGDADLAILQAGAASMDDLSGLVPLFQEVVLVVVRSDRGIESIGDLNGRRMVLKPMGSGMLQAATNLVNHYDLKLAEYEFLNTSYERLADHIEIDGAIMTTGLMNRDLRTLLCSGDFEIIEVSAAAALELRHYILRSTVFQSDFLQRILQFHPSQLKRLQQQHFLRYSRTRATYLYRKHSRSCMRMTFGRMDGYQL